MYNRIWLENVLFFESEFIDCRVVDGVDRSIETGKFN